MALHKADECGILHSLAGHQPDDDHGCLLENGHDGPHEFADRYGQHWLWETDLSCECEWCMKAEGDYCTIYWRKPDDGAEREYVSWFPIAPKEAPSEASRGEVWQAMVYAPQDGSEVELLLHHRNWQCAKGEAKKEWEQVVRATWIDFNGGGWTWSGMSGLPMGWRAPATPGTPGGGRP